MNKLLSAGFARLWKSRVFWLEVIVMLLFFATVMVANYQDVRNYGISYPLDGLFPGSFMLIGFFTSAFASMFLGTEYSDGTIRNKLIMGHGRVSVYLSSLIICFVSTLLVCLSSIALICIMGIPMFGLLTKPLTDTLASIGIGIFIVAAYSAIFTLIAMMTANKPAAVAACIFICIAMYLASMYVSTRLQEPEIYSGYDFTVNGVPIANPPTPNPSYLRGTKRTVYEFINDFLPSGQGFQLATANWTPTIWFPLYSLSITVFATAGGIWLFCRKDIK